MIHLKKYKKYLQEIIYMCIDMNSLYNDSYTFLFLYETYVIMYFGKIQLLDLMFCDFKKYSSNQRKKKILWSFLPRVVTREKFVQNLKRLLKTIEK